LSDWNASGNGSDGDKREANRPGPQPVLSVGTRGRPKKVVGAVSSAGPPLLQRSLNRRHPGFIRAAKTIAAEGSFAGFDGIVPFAELNDFFRENRKQRSS
jgi:hypothetical protein